MGLLLPNQSNHDELEDKVNILILGTDNGNVGPFYQDVHIPTDGQMYTQIQNDEINAE